MTEITDWQEDNTYGDVDHALALVERLCLTGGEHRFTEKVVGPIGNWNCANHRWICALGAAFKKYGFRAALSGRAGTCEWEIATDRVLIVWPAEDADRYKDELAATEADRCKEWDDWERVYGTS